MESFFDNPPEDLEKDESTFNYNNLKDGIKRLQEKYGDNSLPALKEVEVLVEKFLEALGLDRKNGEKQKLYEKYKDVDEMTVRKAQTIVKSYLKRKNFGNIANQFLNSNLAKELGRRNDIWKQVLGSEKAYFQSLVLLYEMYCKPLKMRSMSGSTADTKILTDKQISKIFQNVETIKDIAKAVWKKLESASKTWPESAPRIGNIILTSLPDVRLTYVPYIKGVTSAIKTLSKIKKDNQQFSDFLDRQTVEFTAASSEPALPLSTLLMLPLIRLSQYEGYLKELLILTPPEHADYNDLTRALREVVQLNQEMNSQKVEAQKFQKVFNVNSALKGNVPNLLLKEGRSFIREGPIHMSADKKLKKYYLYLFSDMLVFADVNEASDEKFFESILSLTGTEIKDMSDTPGVPNAISLSNQTKKITLCASTTEEKKSWIIDIGNQIKECNNLKKMQKASVNSPGYGGGDGSSTNRKPEDGGHNNQGGMTDRGGPMSPGSGPSSPFGKDSPTGSNQNTTLALQLQLLQTKTQSSLNNLYTTISPRKGEQIIKSPRGNFTNINTIETLVDSEAFKRALAKQHSSKTLQDFINVLPEKVRVIKLSSQYKSELYQLEGPADETGDDTEHFTDFVAARSISTFPFSRKLNKREGDPICDRYNYAAFKNRMLIAIADGCSIGTRAQQAATRAVNSFVNELRDTHMNIQELRDVGKELLRCAARVHEAIKIGKANIWDAGTTTLLAGILCQTETHASLNNCQWCFNCISIGDCRAYHWSRQTTRIREITEGNRTNLTDSKDPGGRLGPYIYQGAPDLRNMKLYFTGCNEGDLIIICTPGVHDNFDPQVNGYTPKDLKSLVEKVTAFDQEYQQQQLQKGEEVLVSRIIRTQTDTVVGSIDPNYLPEKWEKMDPPQADALKSLYRTKLFEKLITELEYPINPIRVTKRIMDYCSQNTSGLREFMEQNPERVRPNDPKLYPGKIDHSTVMTLQVGPVFI